MPFGSSQIARLPRCLARAGSRRRFIRRQRQLREAIVETAATRPAATSRLEANRVTAIRGVIKRREDEQWA